MATRALLTTITFEGNNIGPTSPVSRVDLQVKTDPEQRTPNWNCCNLSIFLDNSRQTNVLPDQVSVGSISYWKESVPSKDTNIPECDGNLVFYTTYFFFINRDGVENLAN